MRLVGLMTGRVRRFVALALVVLVPLLGGVDTMAGDHDGPAVPWALDHQADDGDEDEREAGSAESQLALPAPDADVLRRAGQAHGAVPVRLYLSPDRIPLLPPPKRRVWV